MRLFSLAQTYRKGLEIELVTRMHPLTLHSSHIVVELLRVSHSELKPLSIKEQEGGC